MLKGLDPLLTPELLQVMAAMGHGDELILSDCNFPSASVAAETVHGQAIHLAGADIGQAAAAIFSLFPLDSFVEAPILRMEVVGKPQEVTPVQEELLRIAHANADRKWAMVSSAMPSMSGPGAAMPWSLRWGNAGPMAALF